MTKEDKELLLKDLCARLPYHVKIKFAFNKDIEKINNLIYVSDNEPSYIHNSCMVLTEDNIKYVFNDWLDEYTWFRSGFEIYYETGIKWTYENTKEESRKYTSRQEFCDNCEGGYTRALKQGWLDDFTGLKPKLIKEAKQKRGLGPTQLRTRSPSVLITATCIYHAINRFLTPFSILS